MKKKMKHLIAVTMCLVLSISVLSGCGSEFREYRFKRKSRQLKHYGLGRNLVGGDVSRLHQRDRN